MTRDEAERRRWDFFNSLLGDFLFLGTNHWHSHCSYHWHASGLFLRLSQLLFLSRRRRVHDAKVIGLNGGLQGRRQLTHAFLSRQFDQHRFSFLVKRSLRSSAACSTGTIISHQENERSPRGRCSSEYPSPWPAHPPSHEPAVGTCRP
jgi:hypothetical protein